MGGEGKGVFQSEEPFKSQKMQPIRLHKGEKKKNTLSLWGDGKPWGKKCLGG